MDKIRSQILQSPCDINSHANNPRNHSSILLTSHPINSSDSRVIRPSLNYRRNRRNDLLQRNSRFSKQNCKEENSIQRKSLRVPLARHFLACPTCNFRIKSLFLSNFLSTTIVTTKPIK